MTSPLDTLLRAARDNAKHFPNDAVWQRHCEKMGRRVHDCHDCGRTKYIDDVFECCAESEEQ